MNFDLTLLGFSPRSTPVLVDIASEAWGRRPEELRLQIIHNRPLDDTTLPEGWKEPEWVPLEDWQPSARDGQVMPGVMAEPASSTVWREVAAKTGLDFSALSVIVHPSAWVSQTATVGPGTWIHPNATVASFAKIGPCCLVNRNASVGHHNVWQAFTRVNPGAHTAGYCELGERVTIGVGAICRDHTHIGDGALVGAGAVVVKDVEAGQTVVGNPAKPLARKN